VASQQKQAACNILNGGNPATSFSTEVEKLHSMQPPQVLFPPNNASGITTMPTISPHISTSGNCTINFIVNVSPSGDFAIGNAQQSSKDNYQYLIDDLDLDEYFTMS